MVDLSGIAGMRASLVDGCRLVFDEPISQVRESVRHVDDLAAVWMDPAVHGAEVAYRVYWHAYRAGDQARFEQHGLDHAIVVLPPARYGEEYAKTQGHYHPPAQGQASSTPELYEILHGQGGFLLQRSAPPYARVDDVVFVSVSAGDIFYVAPDYGHLTINWGDEPLVFEAFVAGDLTTLTGPYQARRGGTHYVVQRPGGRELVPNEHYEDLPPVRSLGSANLKHSDRALYSWAVDHLPELVFLTDPSQFDAQWAL